MSLLNPLTHAFGLDIGDRTFKLVQLIRHTKGKTPTYKLNAWGSIDVPEGIMERGEILDMEKAAEYLKQLTGKANGHLKGLAVVGCLPEARSFVKVIELEDVRGTEAISRAVAQEIEQNIPLPINEIYYDWHLVEHEEAAEPPQPEKETGESKDEEVPPEGQKDDGDAKGKGRAEDGDEGEEKEPAEPEPEKPKSRTRIMLAAAPKKLVEGYVQMMEMAGLTPIALEIEATAIARAMVPLDDPLEDPLGILDIGATRSSLIVCDEGAMQMSISIPLSGNELTEVISKKLQISSADAELVKIECGLDAHRCEDKMWSILLPLIDDMSAKVRNSLRFYRIGFHSHKKIERLYLCGGGAHFRDIDNVLSRKLTIKVRRGDPLANVSRLPKSFPKEYALAYATAIGLGIRASDENLRFRHSFRM